MPQQTLQPPLTSPDLLNATLADQGFAVLGAASVCALAGIPLDALKALEPSWHNLPPDQYLKDGGRYRRRRHASFEVTADRAMAVAHRAHWQCQSRRSAHEALFDLRPFKHSARQTLA